MRSAGVLPYRTRDRLEVLIAHPGGPFWAKKDLGAWSVIKGVIDDAEPPLQAARREFTEETGWEPPAGPWLELGEVRLRSGKRVIAWGAPGDYDPDTLIPGTFEMSLRGRMVTLPEIDRVAWLPIEEARTKLNPVYGEFLDRLEREVTGEG